MRDTIAAIEAIIDGQPWPATARFEVKNPADGSLAGQAPDLGSTALDAAVAAARRAFPSWAAKPWAERQAICQSLADLIHHHAEELAQILSLEQGKPLDGLGARFELGGAEGWTRYSASLTLEPEIASQTEAGRVMLYHRPLGVVASITPWNYPVLIAIWHVIPALLAGNTVVIKPSPYTPLATLRLVEILNKALPAGVLNAVSGSDWRDDYNIGAALSAHEGVNKVVFTGSTKTGQAVMRNAADGLKRVTLELGGNDAGIVLPDVDPTEIAPGLFWGAFLNNGQTCAALKRLYVHDSVHDAVVEALVAYAKTVKTGPACAPDSQLGPIQNRMQFDKVSRLVADAALRGEVVLGGTPGEGLFFPVTLITGLTNGDPLVDEEQFGPALPIIRYSEIEEAIRMANDSQSGLGASVWGRDRKAAAAVGSRLEAGSVWINRHGAIQPDVPFGGHKASGLGVEFGPYGLAEYVNLQAFYE